MISYYKTCVFDWFFKYSVNFLRLFLLLMPLLQEMVSVAVQNVQDMENIIKEPNKNGTNGSLHTNGNDPYKHFVRMASFVLHLQMF